MNNITRKVLMSCGVALTGFASFCGVSYLFTKKLVEIALDRKIPKTTPRSTRLVSGTKLDDELWKSLRKASVVLENKSLKTVNITSYDGERLVGHLYENPNAKRIVVAMHGWRSCWSLDFGSISEFWHNNDCSVLYVEQRGQNNSGGKYMGFGLIERYDCFEWVKWLNKHTQEKLPIYLAGISMGAATVLMTTGFDLPKNVCGVIADCGFTSPYAIFKHVVNNNLNLFYGVVDLFANDMFKKKINMTSKEYSTVEALKRNKIPVLFIHGTQDHFVPVEMTYENYEACCGPKELLIVPGAQHGTSYITDKNKYEETVKKFWNDFDMV